MTAKKNVYKKKPQKNKISDDAIDWLQNGRESMVLLQDIPSKEKPTSNCQSKFDVSSHAESSKFKVKKNAILLFFCPFFQLERIGTNNQ